MRKKYYCIKHQIRYVFNTRTFAHTDTHSHTHSQTLTHRTNIGQPLDFGGTLDRAGYQRKDQEMHQLVKAKVYRLRAENETLQVVYPDGILSSARIEISLVL